MTTDSSTPILAQFELLSDPLPAGFQITNRQVAEHELHSELHIQPLGRQHEGRYVCRARNAYANHSESILSLRVLLPPRLEQVSIDRVDAHLIRIRMRLLNDRDAPLQSIVVQLQPVANNLSQPAVTLVDFNSSVNSLPASPTGSATNGSSAQTNPSHSSSTTMIERRIRFQSDAAGNLLHASLVQPLETQSNGSATLSSEIGSANNVDSNWHTTRSNTTNQSSLDANAVQLNADGDLTVIVDKLQPANTYRIQVFVENLVGRAGPFNTSVGLITTAPDVPSRVRDIHMLAKTNETLLFGWKRPLFDNGAAINRYEVQLAADRQDNWLRNETKDVELNGTPVRNNYMYMFVNLRPGSLYFFRVRGCSDVGCSEWSDPPLSGITQDGLADPPDDIQVRCYAEMVETSVEKSTYNNSSNTVNIKFPNADTKNLTNNTASITPDSNKSIGASKQSPSIDSTSIDDNLNATKIPPSLSESSRPSGELVAVKEWQHFLQVKWLASNEPRGTLLGFNITLEGWAKYVNEHNQEVVDRQLQQFEFKLPETFRFEQRLEMTLRVRPNTRYQVRICSLNKAGCGLPSPLTTSARCDSAPSVQTMRFTRVSRLIEVPSQASSVSVSSSSSSSGSPTATSGSAASSSPVSGSASSSPSASSIAASQSPFSPSSGATPASSSSASSSSHADDASGRLWLATNRVSERDGKIKCYRIVIIPLPNIRRKKDEKLTASKIPLDSNAQNQRDNHLSTASNRSAMSLLPSDPMRVRLTTYDKSHQSLAKLSYTFGLRFVESNDTQRQTLKDEFDEAANVFNEQNLFGYVAKELTSRTLYSPMVIGDNSTSSCETLHESVLVATDDEPLVAGGGSATNEPYQPSAIVSPAAALTLPQSDQSSILLDNGQSFVNPTNTDLEPSVASARGLSHTAFNGRLQPNTEYTGFVEIHVFGNNGTILVQRSAYFEPARTPIEFPAISRDRLSATNRLFDRFFDQNHSKLLAFSTAGVLLLLFILVLFVIMFLRRKVDRHLSTRHESGASNAKSSNMPEKKYNSTVNSYGYDQSSFTSLDQKAFPSWAATSGKPKDALSTYSIYGTISKKSLNHAGKTHLNETSSGLGTSQLITFNHRSTMSIPAPVMTDARLLAILQYTPTAIHLKPHAASTFGQHPWIGQPIPVHQLVDVYRLRHQDDDALFRVEFDMLPYEFSDRTTLCGELAENRVKSRYPDLKLFDQTRVQLMVAPSADRFVQSSMSTNTQFPSPPPSPPVGFSSSYSRHSVDSECSLQRQIDELNTRSTKSLNSFQSLGFVNATHLNLNKAYICAQGPLRHTISDFYQMILEQNVQVIVMLTGVQEQSKDKCAAYWDDSGAVMTINQYLSVQMVGSRHYSDHVLRRLRLVDHSSASTGERMLLHFQFTVWKDFLAPDQPSSWLLRYI